jgi:5-carboxymethyl-2-hydroxymuconate isomerase
MPHIIVEYSAPLAKQYDLSALCEELFEAAMSTSAFDTPQDIKVRMLPASHWFQQVENPSFVHITVRLLVGRTLAQKQEVTSSILQAASQRLTDMGSISVDIKEIARETYVKRTL